MDITFFGLKNKDTILAPFFVLNFFYEAKGERLKRFELADKIFESFKSSKPNDYRKEVLDEYTQVLRSLGDIYLVHGNFEESIEILNQALTLYHNINLTKENKGHFLRCKLSLANAYLESLNLEKAKEIYNVLLPEVEELEDSRFVIALKRSLAFIAVNYDRDYNLGIQYLEACIEVCKNTSDDYNLIVIHQILGNAHMAFDEFAKAEADYQLALQGYQSMGEKMAEASIFNNLGAIAFKNSLIRKPEPTLKQH